MRPVDQRTRRGLSFILAVATMFVVAIPFVMPAAANHPDDLCLDLTPETETTMTGSPHTVTATLRSKVPTPGSADNDEACKTGAAKSPDSGSPVNIDFEVAGANDPQKDGDTPGTPDMTCTITAPATSCSPPTFIGTEVGAETIRGWVDHDGVQSSVEADLTEGQNDVAPGTAGAGDMCSAPAQPAEPDCTDVVTKTWEPGNATGLDCDDSGPPDTERETNRSGQGTQEGSESSEVYTCTVRDAYGNPTSDHGTNTSDTDNNYQILGENETGINDPDPVDGDSEGTPDYGCQVANDGSCTVTITQSENEQGLAEICFWIRDIGLAQCQSTSTAPEQGEPTGEAQNADGSDTANDPADQVELRWEGPALSGVDAEPETDTNQLGENHTITATVYNQFGERHNGATQVFFEFFQGSPSDTDGNTPNTPDGSCTAPANGSSCTYTYTQTTTVGTDAICVYLDQDRPTTANGTQGPPMFGTNTSPTCGGATSGGETGPEGLNDADDDPATADAPQPGTDDQDVVQKTWQSSTAAQRLDCLPETDSNPTGTSHTVTCTARNAAAATVSGVDVDVEVTGVNDPDGNAVLTSPDFSCTTNSSGQCSFTHGPTASASTAATGVTTYRAWIDSDRNNASAEADTGEGRDEVTTPGRAEPDETDVVEKTWVSSSPSPSASASRSPSPPPSECSDGIDNDDDGDTDLSDDGCESSADDDESDEVVPVPRQCRNRGSNENVIAGTPGNDVLRGTGGRDVMCGAGGDDVMSGRGGADLMVGNGGNDTMGGGGGKDNVSGNGGDDTASGNRGNDAVKGNAGNDAVKGNAGIDTLPGGGGNDTIQGGDGQDILKGGGGNDTLRGGKGRDALDGGEGRDQCFGNAGNDSVRRCE